MRRLQAEIDSQEFSELLARHLYIEPIGQPWKQVAQLCAVIAGLFSKEAKPEHYLPILKPATPNQNQIKAALKAFAATHNASVKRASHRQ